MRKTPVNSSHLNRNFTRTDLFLVRIWTKGAEGNIHDEADINSESEGSRSEAAGRGEGVGKLEWRGTVQRAVDGEVHQFSSWQGLTDLLVKMVANNKGR